MKKFHHLIAAALCLCLCFCTDDSADDAVGVIHGFVTDFATGEPVGAANVQLRPSGRTTLTGNDGRYEFANVAAGNYALSVSKLDYSELIEDFTITVTPNAVIQRDVQIQSLPVSLRLVSGGGTNDDITGLDFGDGAASTRTFSIFNNGARRFDWEAVNTTDWISVNPQTGSIQPGAQQSVTVTIDRNLQGDGVHNATISIITTPGSGTRDLNISTRHATLALAVNQDHANWGTVSRDPSAEFYAWGSTVRITASPASGYQFDHWTITGGQAQIANANSASTDIVLQSDAVTVTANFKEIVQGGGSGKTLAAQLLELHASAASGGTYVVDLAANELIGVQPLSFSNRTDITIHLIGVGEERIVTLADNGSLFTIGAGITLILDNNVTLRGRSANNAPLVRVSAMGTLEMRAGSRISGNANNGWSQFGGGVFVETNANFTMTGGEISGNSATGSNGGGAGVYLASGAHFAMSGGRINNNNASSGGGVYIAGGAFVLSKGDVINNTATAGGGVFLSGGSFTMSGDSSRVVSNNASTTSTTSGGGGIHVANSALFTMEGGEIASNTANNGGGVFVSANSRIVKTGGTIFGYSLGDINRNTATSGIAGSDRGHAVFVNTAPNKRRETTAGPGLNLNSNTVGAAGGWE